MSTSHAGAAGSAEHHAHPAYLQHHFDTPVQQFDAGKLGMWLFLVTEVLLFGGLFCAYAVYRANHPEVFVAAHVYLDKYLGAVNTVVLLVSSLTMAWAVRCAQRSQQRGLVLCLSLTLLGGAIFLGVKYVEYSHKFHGGLLPGKHFSPKEHHDAHGTDHSMAGLAAAATAEQQMSVEAPPRPVRTRTKEGVEVELSLVPLAPDGPEGLAHAEEVHHGQDIRHLANVQTFFSIYFLMTGLHGIHVVAGMVAIGWILVLALRGRFSAAYFTPVDLVGLYWHLVDLIWIYLFPLLYLIH